MDQVYCFPFTEFGMGIFFLFFHFVVLSIFNNHFWSLFPSAIPYADVIDT